MIDPRMTKLANLLVNYSCKVKKGDNVLVEAIDIPHEFTRTLVAVIADAGGRPIVWIKSNVVNRALMLSGSQEQWQTIADAEKAVMRKTQCYLGVRGSENVSEMSDVPADKQQHLRKHRLETSASRRSREAHSLVRAALADRLDGPDGRDVHRSL